MMGILFLIRDRQTIVGPCRGTIRQCGKWVHGELIHSLGSIQSNQMPSTWKQYAKAVVVTSGRAFAKIGVHLGECSLGL